jgi:hypothetical protein
MAIYDLYRINAATVQEAKSILESVLSIDFEERDSIYHRGPYFSHGNIGSENFEIKVNIDPFEDVAHEDDFPINDILLYINNTDRSEKLKLALTDSGYANIIRHEDI